MKAIKIFIYMIILFGTISGAAEVLIYLKMPDGDEVGFLFNFLSMVLGCYLIADWGIELEERKNGGDKDA